MCHAKSSADCLCLQRHTRSGGSHFSRIGIDYLRRSVREFWAFRAGPGGFPNGGSGESGHRRARRTGRRNGPCGSGPVPGIQGPSRRRGPLCPSSLSGQTCPQFSFRSPALRPRSSLRRSTASWSLANPQSLSAKYGSSRPGRDVSGCRSNSSILHADGFITSAATTRLLQGGSGSTRAQSSCRPRRKATPSRTCERRQKTPSSRTSSSLWFAI